MRSTDQWMLHTVDIKWNKVFRSLPIQCLKPFFPEFHFVLITKYMALKCCISTYYRTVFCVHSQGNRFALEKHVDDNTKQHLMLMCTVVTKQQHQIVSLKSALSRLSLNYSGNRQLLQPNNCYNNQKKHYGGLIDHSSVHVSDTYKA
jgi:hypothetical protein